MSTMTIVIRMLLFAALLIFLRLPMAVADPEIPPLTGRVVDLADVLTTTAERDLTNQLAKLEEKIGVQIVVATLPRLGLDTIESWGLALGRGWQIGHKGKDDGIVIVLAPNDREVRIEVGYGLEGDVPDAKADKIVRGVLLPAFRDGRYAVGLSDAIEALGSLIVDPSTPVPERNAHIGLYIVLLLVSGIIVMLWFAFRTFPLGKDLALAAETDAGSMRDDSESSWHSTGSSTSRRESSHSSRGPSFGGRGGSFGGGGASGKW
jgi:uncharacterized protein